MIIMRSFIRTAAAALAALLILASTALAAAFVPAEPIMPLSQVKPGMLAEARTVMEGTRITPFKVRVVGVLPKKTSPRALILIKIEDKKVVENGGVAAGMSGSPVYIGGRLIGAIGYSWSFSDRSLGLVTPIEEMMKAFDWPDKVQQLTPAPVVYEKPASADVKSSADIEEASKDLDTTETSGDISFDVIISADEKAAPVSGEIKEQSGDQNISPDLAEVGGLQLKPLSMPLLSDGLSPGATEALGRRLGREILPLGSSSAAVSTNLHKTLKPGAAIGVSLVWGDINLSGIGTLTAVDKDGRFLAFGHPMEGAGAVAYPLTEASIVRIIPSQEHSFKLGSVGPIIGLVTQDRPEAIGGHFGRLAPADSYTVKFNDVDAKKQTVKRFQTISDTFAGPRFGSLGMLAVIDDLWARKGEGTAMLNYRFTGGGLPGGWQRRNIFFDDKDLVNSMLKEFDEIAQIFAVNQFRGVKPFGVEMNVEVTRSPRVVFIEKLVVVNEKKAYAPGDQVELAVTLRPWRKQPVVRRLKLRVPPKAAGFCEVVVHGGGIEEPGEDALEDGKRALTNLDDLLKELSIQETNNQIVAEIGGPEGPDLMEKLKELKSGKKEDSPLPKALTDDRLRSEVREENIKNGGLVIVDTNYYVEGALRKFIKIRKNPLLEDEPDITDAEAAAMMKDAGKSKKDDKKESGKRPEELPELTFEEQSR